MYVIFLYVCFYIPTYILWHYIAYNNLSYRVLCYRLSIYMKYSKAATEVCSAFGLQLPKVFLNMVLRAQGMCRVHQQSRARAVGHQPQERHLGTNQRKNHNSKRLYFQTKNSAPNKVYLSLWHLNSNRHYIFSTAKITINWEIKRQAQCQQKSQIY